MTFGCTTDLLVLVDFSGSNVSGLGNSSPTVFSCLSEVVMYISPEVEDPEPEIHSSVDLLDSHEGHGFWVTEEEGEAVFSEK